MEMSANIQNAGKSPNAMQYGLRIIIFVIIMGTVSGVLLIGINALTAERIAKNEELKLKSAVLDVLELPYGRDDALALFEKNVKVVKKDENIFYEGADSTVAFEFDGPGLWGPIKGIISINADLKSIRAIKILRQEETPGLGSRIAEKAYLSQFKNKEFSSGIVFRPEGQAGANNEVDAITGATGSSKALEKLLNETLQKRIKVFKSL